MVQDYYPPNFFSWNPGGKYDSCYIYSIRKECKRKIKEDLEGMFIYSVGSGNYKENYYIFSSDVFRPLSLVFHVCCIKYP